MRQIVFALMLAFLLAPAARATVEVDVVSFNIAKGQGLPNDSKKFVGDKYLKMVAAFVKALSPDLVGMQEVGRNMYPTRFVDQDQWLAPRLGYQHYIWDYAKQSLGGLVHRQGNAVFSRHPIVERRTIRYEARGTAGGAASEPRMAIVAFVVVGGYRIAFVSTHLGFPEEARVGQARELVAALEGLAEPVILVGDFNTPKGSPSYRILAAAFDDTWELARPGEPKVTLPGSKKGIDHIFVTKGRFEVLKTCVFEAGEVSDHHLLLARLRLDPRGLKREAVDAKDEPSTFDKLKSKLRNVHF